MRKDISIMPTNTDDIVLDISTFRTMAVEQNAKMTWKIGVVNKARDLPRGQYFPEGQTMDVLDTEPSKQ